jgi:hypothetical protein
MRRYHPAGPAGQSNERALGLIFILIATLTGCGRDSVAVPSPAEPTTAAPAALPPPPALPAGIYGAFASSGDVPEAAAHAGNVLLVIPSYADDPELVAAALAANRKMAIVSAHHVFGGPRSGWGVEVGSSGMRPGTIVRQRGVSYASVGGWQRTLAWMEPLRRRGLVAAVYVVDEPLHNGILGATRDEAVRIVRAAGFRTVVGEWVDQAIRSGRPPGLDLYGVTCYDWPGQGGWRQDRCLTAYADRPEWDLVLGQAFDLHTRNGAAATQIRAWAEIARSKQKAGVLYWVARWPGQTGLLDDGELLAAYDQGGR